MRIRRRRPLFRRWQARRATTSGKALLAAGALLAGSVWRWLGRKRRYELRGRGVLVTGGSRGLGLLLARKLLEAGARVALCARDGEELERARGELLRAGARERDVLTSICDVADPDEVQRWIAEVEQRFGRIDVLVNNAGVIQVGPVQDMALGDFQRAMDVMFYGVLHPTMAVLPRMVAQRSGRIVNVTSIGGKVGVPHLLPYDSAKFAAVGFSEGLRAELAGTGVKVCTIVPGLMRTGSFVNAELKGQTERELTWFSLGATAPLLSMDPERAADRIVRALRDGAAERIIGLPAKLLALFHGLFPGTTARLLGLVNRLALPRRSADGAGQPAQLGHEVAARTRSGPLGRFWSRASARLNQPRPHHEPVA